MREEEDVKVGPYSYVINPPHHWILQLYLSRAIDPPKVVAMEKAWSILEEVGAVDQAGELTALGRHIVRNRSFSPISVSFLSSPCFRSIWGLPRSEYFHTLSPAQRADPVL
jgi:hypothetical protein